MILQQRMSALYTQTEAFKESRRLKTPPRTSLYNKVFGKIHINKTGLGLHIYAT